MALSHSLKISLDLFSRLLKLVLGMSSADYKKAYQSAKKELADLITTQDRLERRKVELRKSLEVLSALCKSEEIEVEQSHEALYLLENTLIADEVRSILKSQYPGWQRPTQLLEELQRLGRDLSSYTNPLATVHMVLKRMSETGEVQETINSEGKKVYRCPTLADSIGRYRDGEAARKLRGLQADSIPPMPRYHGSKEKK